MLDARVDDLSQQVQATFQWFLVFFTSDASHEASNCTRIRDDEPTTLLLDLEVDEVAESHVSEKLFDVNRRFCGSVISAEEPRGRVAWKIDDDLG